MISRGFDRNELKIGSVERFQGQERRVIIVSTVRSSKEFIDIDVEHNLGFVKNPKRFNVACTRAQALLIIIGSPALLCTDEHWNALLRHCEQHSSCVGVALPPSPSSAPQ